MSEIITTLEIIVPGTILLIVISTPFLVVMSSCWIIFVLSIIVALTYFLLTRNWKTYRLLDKEKLEYYGVMWILMWALSLISTILVAWSGAFNVEAYPVPYAIATTTTISILIISAFELGLVSHYYDKLEDNTAI